MSKKKSIIVVICKDCDNQMIRSVIYNMFNPFRKFHAYYICEKCKKLIEIIVSKKLKLEVS